MAEQYLGEIRQVGFNFAPLGWLMCDGSLQSISSNDALYTLLGTTYGGDGVQTFGLPDLRGRCPLGQGAGPNGTYILGQVGGSEQVTLTAQQLPLHLHPIKASSTQSGTNPASSTFGPSTAQYEASVGGFASGNMLTPTGSSQPHENRMPLLVINYIISTTGLYPSSS